MSQQTASLKIVCVLCYTIAIFNPTMLSPKSFRVTSLLCAWKWWWQGVNKMSYIFSHWGSTGDCISEATDTHKCVNNLLQYIFGNRAIFVYDLKVVVQLMTTHLIWAQFTTPSFFGEVNNRRKCYCHTSRAQCHLLS